MKNDGDARWSGRLIIVVILLVLLGLVVAGARAFFKDYALRQEIARLQTEVGTLERRKIESLETLKKLQSDNYVEERGRQEFQVRRPGETVLVVPGLTVTSTATTAVPSPAAPRALSNPEKWWYYFFHYGK